MTMFEIHSYAIQKIPILKDWNWRRFANWFRYMEKKGYAQVFMEENKIIGLGVARPVQDAEKAKDRCHVYKEGSTAYVDLFTCELGKDKEIFLKRLLQATGLRKNICFKRGYKQRLVTLNMEKFIERFKVYG